MTDLLPDQPVKPLVLTNRTIKHKLFADGSIQFYALFTFRDRNNEAWTLESALYASRYQWVVDAQSYEEEVEAGCDPIETLSKFLNACRQIGG